MCVCESLLDQAGQGVTPWLSTHIAYMSMSMSDQFSAFHVKTIFTHFKKAGECGTCILTTLNEAVHASGTRDLIRMAP